MRMHTLLWVCAGATALFACQGPDEEIDVGDAAEVDALTRAAGSDDLASETPDDDVQLCIDVCSERVTEACFATADEACSSLASDPFLYHACRRAQSEGCIAFGTFNCSRTCAAAVEDGRVAICHATHADARPFVALRVRVKGLAGHGDHPDDLIPAPAGGCPTPDDDELPCDGAAP